MGVFYRGPTRGSGIPQHSGRRAQCVVSFPSPPRSIRGARSWRARTSDSWTASFTSSPPRCPPPKRSRKTCPTPPPPSRRPASRFCSLAPAPAGPSPSPTPPTPPPPTEIDPWRALRAREDVRLVDGVLHLVTDEVSPAEAVTQDLLDVAAALEAAGIEVLLVRDSNRRPKLVADAATGPTALRSLQSARPGEPFYLKGRGEDEVQIGRAHV